MRKKGNRIQIDSDTVFIDRHEDGFLLLAMDDACNMLELRQNHAYRTLMLHFVNTGVGEARNCRITVSANGLTRDFSSERHCLPDEEREIVILYAQEAVSATPVTFRLTFWDICGSQYIQEYAFTIEAEYRHSDPTYPLITNSGG